MERATRFELVPSAWKAVMLPLNTMHALLIRRIEQVLNCFQVAQLYLKCSYKERVCLYRETIFNIANKSSDVALA